MFGERTMSEDFVIVMLELFNIPAVEVMPAHVPIATR